MSNIQTVCCSFACVPAWICFCQTLPQTQLYFKIQIIQSNDLFGSWKPPAKNLKLLVSLLFYLIKQGCFFQFYTGISSVWCMLTREGISPHCHDSSFCLRHHVSECVLGLFPDPVQQLLFSHHNAHDADSFLWAFVCTAETERPGTDHLDLAGLPQRSANSDSTNTLSTTPEGRKKAKGIKKLFGKWVENCMIISSSKKL